MRIKLYSLPVMINGPFFSISFCLISCHCRFHRVHTYDVWRATTKMTSLIHISHVPCVSFVCCRFPWVNKDFKPNFYVYGFWGHVNRFLKNDSSIPWAPKTVRGMDMMGMCPKLQRLRKLTAGKYAQHLASIQLEKICRKDKGWQMWWVLCGWYQAVMECN